MINDRFAPKCPTCGRAQPRSPFSGKYESTWGCIACPLPICTWCYVAHTATVHPNLGVAA